MPNIIAPLVINALFDKQHIRLVADCFEIEFEAGGRDDFSGISNTFALWISLPIAMSLNRDLHILGRVSPSALNNARQLIKIWYAWRPDVYHMVNVSAEQPEESLYDEQRGDIMLYSGGADSTYALITHYLKNNLEVAALTIHGMDYSPQDTTRFKALMAKTQPLRELAIKESYTLRSNAAEVMKRFGTDADCGHGFQLFGSLFLFEDRYSRGSIAADSSIYLEPLIFPWGTSSITNCHFASQAFHIHTFDLDIDRPAKLTALSTNPTALNCISFCKKRDIRPENCGLCSKCTRTKAMFLAETGQIPDIFIDNSFDEDMLSSMDLNTRGDRASAINLLTSAALHDRLSLFPKLVQRVSARPAKKTWLQRKKMKWLKRLKLVR